MNPISHSSILALGAAFLMSGLCAQKHGETPAAAPEPVQHASEVHLSMESTDESIHLAVARRVEPGEERGEFFGGILLSLQPTLCHYLNGLPPMLCDNAVLSAGFAKEQFRSEILRARMPPGTAVFAQGIVADSRGIGSSQVMRIDSDEQ